MEISVTGFIYCKDSELFIDCADRYAINMVNLRFAISDGVTKSFFPNHWAEILVKEFVNSDGLTINHESLITKAQKKWRDKISEIIMKPDVKWYTRNAYNRGDSGLATFVGLQLNPKDKKWTTSALGDSFLFFIPESFSEFDEKVVILPQKDRPIQFDNFPDYFDSIGTGHKGVRTEFQGVLRDGTFYLMTDALAEWFLKEKEAAIEKIENLHKQIDFEKFVKEERSSKKLGNDDSAILIIKVSQVKNSQVKVTKSIQVSDIEELIENEKKVEMKKS